MSSASPLFAASRCARAALLWLGTGLLALSAQADTGVGVSVSINQPGFYGRINIGDQPPPPVIYAEPVIIQRGPVTSVRHPIYLRVPPEHSRNWARYCGRYKACGQPVYFVRDDADMGHGHAHAHGGRPDAHDDAQHDQRRDGRDRDDDRHEGHGHGQDRDR